MHTTTELFPHQDVEHAAPLAPAQQQERPYFSRVGIGLAGLGLAASSLLAGCSEDKPTPPPAAAIAPEQICFDQMNAGQLDELQEYAAQNSDKVGQLATGDICIIESGPQGDEMHYYTSEDRFGNYMPYALLTGQSRHAANYGMVSGELDVSQALALSLVNGVRDNGEVYRLWAYSDSSGWCRQPVIAMERPEVHITAVRYGDKPAIPIKEVRKKAPPKGYEVLTIPPMSTTQATASKAPDGKHSTINTAKNTAPANNYGNPAQNTSSSTGAATVPKTGASAPPAGTSIRGTDNKPPKKSTTTTTKRK